MILVTGGTSLVGSHILLHLIENGEKVRAIYREKASSRNVEKIFSSYKKQELFDRIEWIKADILEVPSLETAFKDIDFVYHCAAFSSFNPKDENTIRKINIEGTANVVNFCLSYKIKKIVFMSSIMALGTPPPQESIISETTPWNPEQPHSDYAISKHGAEMEIWRGQQEGLNVLIINPGIMLGTKLSKLFFDFSFNKLRFYTLGKTGFVTPNDVARITIELMKSHIINEQFILIENNYLFREIVNTLTDVQIKKPQFYARPWMIEIFWRLDWFLASFFFQKRRLPKRIAKYLYSKNHYSNAKIKAALEVEFEKIF